MNCPRCNQPVRTAIVGDRVVTLDAQPSSDGTVALDPETGRGAFLAGPAWDLVRTHTLPVYRRHNIWCRQFWAGRGPEETR